MQQTRLLHRRFYHIGKIDETEYSHNVYDRKKKLELYEKLINEGCSQKTALEAIQTSRANFYRWKKKYQLSGLGGLENECRAPNIVRQKTWTRETESKVYNVRKNFPLWGKYKIAAFLYQNHGIRISVSMVGRILNNFLKRGTVKPVSFYYGKRERKKRVFHDHAQRWKRGMKAQRPGELIQVDHMKVQLDSNTCIIHFKAICPVTKITVEQAYKRATSSTAAEFFNFMKLCFPFAIQSIQVDGGSEFMGEFEGICKENKVPLFVLPPRSPEYNGCVERANGTVKYEFYSLYDGPVSLKFVRRKLQKFVNVYNKIRPHQALQYSTPWQYYHHVVKREAFKSHM